MICYIVRHGKDDDSVRGGWSNTPLTVEGKKQVEQLANDLAHSKLDIGKVYSSDLVRAKQTAEILGSKLNLDIEYLTEFREVNNGFLAGMKNDLAKVKYPNLYWNTLEWDECYPNGESPHHFFERISNAWELFKKKVRGSNTNVMLVTHGGVINIIYHIEQGLPYSNKTKAISVKNAEIISFEI